MYSSLRALLTLTVLFPLLSACSHTQPSVTPGTLVPPTTLAVTLRPYSSPSPSATLAPPAETATPLPAPSATPYLYRVKAGEDMSLIALRFGIPLDALVNANPQVNPRAMGVGTQLIIPAVQRATPTVQAPTPTPVALTLDPPVCHPTAEGGLWCFALAHNTQDSPLENLIARIRVAGVPAEQVLEMDATAPLNRLAPQASLPLVAYFPPNAPAPFQASAELISAIPVAGDERYLNAHSEDSHTQIAADGLSAQVSGAVLLDVPERSAAHVWVAATAYDAQNQLVGVRRWENQQPLASGERLPFDFWVYSIAGPIQRVDLQVEARP